MNLSRRFRGLFIILSIVFFLSLIGFLGVGIVGISTGNDVFSKVAQEAIIEVEYWQRQTNLFQDMHITQFMGKIDQWWEESEVVKTKFLRAIIWQSAVLPQSEYLDVVQKAWGDLEKEKQELLDTFEFIKDQTETGKMTREQAKLQLYSSLSGFSALLGIFLFLLREWYFAFIDQSRDILVAAIIIFFAVCVILPAIAMLLQHGMKQYIFTHMRMLGSLLHVKNWQQMPDVVSEIRSMHDVLKIEQDSARDSQKMREDLEQKMRDWLQFVKQKTEFVYESVANIPDVVKNIEEYKNFRKGSQRMMRKILREIQTSLLFEQPLEKTAGELRNFFHQFSQLPHDGLSKATIMSENLQTNLHNRREIVSELGKRIHQILTQGERNMQTSKELDEIIDKMFILAMNTALGMKKKSQLTEGFSEKVHKISEEIQHKQGLLLNQQKTLMKKLEHLFVDISALELFITEDKLSLKELFDSIASRKKDISVTGKIIHLITDFQEDYDNYGNTLESSIKNFTNQITMQSQQDDAISDIARFLQEQHKSVASWYQEIYARVRRIEEYLSKTTQVVEYHEIEKLV